MHPTDNPIRVVVEPSKTIMVVATTSGSTAQARVEKPDAVSIAVDVVNGTGGPALPEYVGGYTVTPRTSTDIVLDTKGKALSENVTVKTVPYYEVSNPSGGMSIFIPDGESQEIQ